MTMPAPNSGEPTPEPSYTEEAFLLASMDTRDKLGVLADETPDFARDQDEEQGRDKALRHEPATNTRWLIRRTGGAVMDVEEYVPPTGGVFTSTRMYEFNGDGMTMAVIPYDQYDALGQERLESGTPPEAEFAAMSTDDKLELMAALIGKVMHEVLSAMPFDAMMSIAPVAPGDQEALLRRLRQSMPLAIHSET